MGGGTIHANSILLLLAFKTDPHELPDLEDLPRSVFLKEEKRRRKERGAGVKPTKPQGEKDKIR